MSERVLRAVTDHLTKSGVQFAVAGASAMVVRGFARQTLDFDLLTTDTNVLADTFWTAFELPAEIRRGEADDPLAGVVRFIDPAIDIVVGRFRWQSDAVARAEPLSAGSLVLPVLTVADLVITKLYAGGFRDLNDAAMMVDGMGADDLSAIDSMVGGLDEAARAAWSRVREQGS